MDKANVIIVCGVSGCGKSTIGAALAKRLSARFTEGDKHHPQKNIDKMSSGCPLTDQDRAQWLDNICADLNNNAGGLNVLACSALTPYVQNFLTKGIEARINWIKLEISENTALTRMQTREHFMPPTLLQSQFEAWNPPAIGLTISAEQPVNSIVNGICDYLNALTEGN